MTIIETMARAIHGPAYHGEMEARDRDPILVALQTQPIQAALRAVKPEDVSNKMGVAFNAVLEKQYPYFRVKYDFETLRRAIAAAIAAGAEQ